MLCLDTKLSDCDCCKTNVNNLPEIYIKNKFILKKYKHRNMWTGSEYKLIGNDESLIGKTIKVASPMTCSCVDGICRTCYGELYKTVSTKKLKDGREIKENIGLIAVLLLTEVLTQSLLSTKHLLEAKTDDIEWNGLEYYFDIYSNDMILKDDFNIKSIKILDLDDDDINKISIDGKEFDLPVSLNLNKNYKLVKDNEEVEMYSIEDEDSENNNDSNNNSLFNFTVKNKELSDPLKKINSLLNSSQIKDRDINGNINYMMELLDAVGFKISSEHIEVVMRELIKIDSRKDFECMNPEYEFISAKAKVLQDSVIKSLLFERLENQLLKIETYEKNNENSLLDFLL